MSASTLRKAAVAGFVVLLLAAASLHRVPTTFGVRAVTQLLVLETSPDHRSPWHFADASVLGVDGSSETFTGSVLVRPQTRVVFERIGQGPLLVDIGAGSGAGPVATLRPAGGGAVDAEGPLVLHVVPGAGGTGAALVLPMVGRVEVGSEVGIDPGDRPALLQEGAVTLLAHTILGERRYDAGSATLELGDYPRLDSAAVAHGLLVVGPEPDMAASFRIVAEHLRINRFGSAGYEVYASWLDRLKNDHVLQGLWAAAAFVLAWLARLGPGLRPARPKERDHADATPPPAPSDTRRPGAGATPGPPQPPEGAPVAGAAAAGRPGDAG